MLPIQIRTVKVLQKDIQELKCGDYFTYDEPKAERSFDRVYQVINDNGLVIDSCGPIYLCVNNHTLCDGTEDQLVYPLTKVDDLTYKYIFVNEK